MHPTDDHGPAPIDASLHLLADHLVDELRSGDFPPSLLHVTAGDAEGFDLGVRPLDGQHPSELLVGFRAPRDWHAIGIATGGWAYHVSERASSARKRTRVHIVTVLSRTGEFAHRTKVEDDSPLGAVLEDPAERPGGEQVDLLRRALDLPTDPPPCGSEVYWAIDWLSELLGRDVDARTSWATVLDAHPAVTMARRIAGVPPTSFTDEDLLPVAAGLPRFFDWTRMREGLAEGFLEVPELAPAHANWFDDGAFARFVLNRCPPLSMLRAQLGERLDPVLARRLGATLDVLGIPQTCWPDDADGRAA
jgi:hypothetical protein